MATERRVAGSVIEQPAWRHYAWVIVAVTFTVLFMSAGVRAAAGVLIVPLEREFGWDRASISLAVAVSLLALGFGAPIAGGFIDRVGPRLVMLGGVTLIAAGLAPMLLMGTLWQFHLLWGIIVGLGTGAVANVMGATVANRWFVTHRGMIIGLLGAAASAGQLVFLPIMTLLVVQSGWRASIGLMAVVAGVLLVPVLFFMRNRPEEMGIRPFGDKGLSADGGRATHASVSATRPERRTSVAEAVRTRDFWLLAGSFFVCGYTSNGLVGTHLIPHAIEHGFTEVTAAGAVGLMGMMNVIGTLASGWLSDRFDNRKLLACYYGFRALSIAALPFIFETQHLLIFAVVYGLDWIATVPPTVNLTATRFGRASLGTLYGWIFCSHMIGAALAAYAGGFFHNILGDYHLIFISAALMGMIAVGLSMNITSARRMALAKVAGGD